MISGRQVKKILGRVQQIFHMRASGKNIMQATTRYRTIQRPRRNIKSRSRSTTLRHWRPSPQIPGASEKQRSKRDSTVCILEVGGYDQDDAEPRIVGIREDHTFLAMKLQQVPMPHGKYHERRESTAVNASHASRILPQYSMAYKRGLSPATGTFCELHHHPLSLPSAKQA